GDHTFTLVVTDDDGADSAPDSVTISVNAPPVANAGADRNVNIVAGNTTVDVTLDGSLSSDADGTIAAYAWTGTPDPSDVVGPTVTLAAGDHTFTLVVTDDDGADSAPDSVTISVSMPPVAVAAATPNPAHSDAGQSPIIVPDPDTLYAIPAGFYYLQSTQLTELDPTDGTVNATRDILLPGSGGWRVYNGIGLACHLETGEGWAIVQIDDMYNPTPSWVDAYLIKLDLNTGVGEVIGLCNDTLSFVDLTCDGDGNLYALASSGSDDALYTLSTTDASETLVHTFTGYWGGGIAFNSLDGLLYYATTADPSGTPYGALHSFDIATSTLTALPPTAAAFSWTRVAALTHEPLSNTLFLSDIDSMVGDLLSMVDNGTVDEASIANYDPYLGAITFGCSKRAVPEEVQLDGSSSYHPGGGTITGYHWTVVSVPAGSAVTAVSDDSIVNPTFTPDVQGDYEFSLIVTDGSAFSDPDSIVVTYENTPPVAEAGLDRSLKPGKNVYANGNDSYDIDCDDLEFAWTFTSVPAGSFVDDTYLAPSANCPAPFFWPDQEGDYVLELTVTEVKATPESDTDSVTINIDSGTVKKR
ncbi:MAG TPA: PKD domain-containing protein, partial [Candidatus Hydrogenedentes bacterium]|nr:PKD domain-containing protein [Candidatus Hydrogenedentota bacterium]